MDAPADDPQREAVYDWQGIACWTRYWDPRMLPTGGATWTRTAWPRWFPSFATATSQASESFRSRSTSKATTTAPTSMTPLRRFASPHRHA